MKRIANQKDQWVSEEVECRDGADDSLVLPTRQQQPQRVHSHSHTPSKYYLLIYYQVVYNNSHVKSFPLCDVPVKILTTELSCIFIDMCIKSIKLAFLVTDSLGGLFYKYMYV